MGIAWGDVLISFAWGGAMALERKAFLQAMLSRPLVSCASTGLFLGHVESGLALGMVLELYYLGSASLGAAVPEHDTLVATGTTAAACSLCHISGSPGTPAQWSLSLLAFLWLGMLGRSVDRMLGRYSSRLATRAQESAERGELSRAVRQNLWGMWPHFVIFGAITAACAIAGGLAAGWVNLIPLRLTRGLAWAYPAMGSVAAAVAAQSSRARNAALWAGGAAAVVAIVTFAMIWHGGAS